MKEFLKKSAIFFGGFKNLLYLCTRKRGKDVLSGVVIGWRFYTRSAFWCHSSVGRASD